MPKTRSMRPAVSVELRLVIDTDGHGHAAIASTRTSMASSGYFDLFWGPIFKTSYEDLKKILGK